MKPTYEQLVEENAQLKAIIKRLEARISDLEAQLKQNSQNSSKPPSSGQKSNLPSLPRKEHRSYHQGASRQPLPEDAVTSREIRVIKDCPHCGRSMKPTGEVFKWQQIELPEIKPLVHRIELHTYRCAHCNFVGRPNLLNHEQLLLGPRMEAFVNVCLGQFRHGHRAVREFVATIFPGLHLSQGLISKVKARTAHTFERVHEGSQRNIFETDLPTHVDATGWRHLGKNENAIVIRAGDLISFSLVPRQNSEALSKIFRGHRVKHVVTDRGLSVSRVAMRPHQYCLAHLLRNVQGLAEHPATTLDETTMLGKVYDTIQDLFHDKHRLDREETTVSTWRQYGYTKWNYVREVLEDLLEVVRLQKWAVLAKGCCVISVILQCTFEVVITR